MMCASAWPRKDRLDLYRDRPDFYRNRPDLGRDKLDLYMDRPDIYRDTPDLNIDVWIDQTSLGTDTRNDARGRLATRLGFCVSSFLVSRVRSSDCARSARVFTYEGVRG